MKVINDSTFHLKWRCQKHVRHHKNMKFCHFFCCADTQKICKYNARSELWSQTREDQDIFKHVISSTPIEEDIMKHQCKVCAFEKLPGQQFFKQENTNENPKKHLGPLDADFYGIGPPGRINGLLAFHWKLTWSHFNVIIVF